MQSINFKHHIPNFAWVNIEKIHVGQYQPRQHFDDSKIKELAESIAQYGVLQPLLLKDNYELIAGERRWRAALWLGLKELPCMLLPASAEHHALMSILENIQREQIEPLEEALAYQRLQREFSWTQEHMAQLLGKSRTHVTNMLRLLKLSVIVLDALATKQLSYGHARVLVGLSEEQQKQYVDWIKKNNCSVRQVEQRVRQDKKIKMNKVVAYEHFTREMGEKLGTIVEYEELKSGEGWLKFKFFNQETLEGLLEKLGLSYD